MKKIAVFILIMFCCKLVSFAQKVNTSKWPKEEQAVFESANALFDEKLYSLAYERYKSVLQKHPEEIYIKYLLGICGIFISDKYEEALAYLHEVEIKNNSTMVNLIAGHFCLIPASLERTEILAKSDAAILRVEAN